MNSTVNITSEHTRLLGFETENGDSVVATRKGYVEKCRTRGAVVVSSLVFLLVAMAGIAGFVAGKGGFSRLKLAITGDPRGDIAYGGVVGSTLSYPFAVRLGITGFGDAACSGSLLSRTVILTAAHCLNDVNAADVTVTAGQVTKGANANTRQVRTASRLTKHAEAAGLQRDVGIIEVNPPFDLSTSVDIIGLGEARPGVGTQLTAIGWGTDENGNSPNDLKSATMNVHTGVDCLADAFEICTKGGTGSTCAADSGCPLVWQRDGVYHLVGINERSPTTHCRDREGNVDIFESVPNYLAWIRNHLPTVTSRASSQSCLQTCTAAGSAPIESGIYNGNAADKFYMCAVNADNKGFRGGYNLEFGNFQGSCMVAGGVVRLQAFANFNCLCSPKLVAFEPSAGQSCKQVCESRNTKPVETGQFEDGSKFYACSADGGDGFRGGYNLDRIHTSNACYFEFGGHVVWINDFKCICV